VFSGIVFSFFIFYSPLTLTLMLSRYTDSSLVSAIESGLALLQEVGGAGRLALVIRRGRTVGVTVTIKAPPLVSPVSDWLDGLVETVARSAGYGEVEIEVGAGGEIAGGTLTFSMKPDQMDVLRPGLEQLVGPVEMIR
jgi:hypothetical protein